MVVLAEQCDKLIAIPFEIFRSTFRVDYFAFVGRHRHEGERIGRVVETENFVLRLDGRKPTHDRRVQKLAVRAFENHLLVNARRIALAHQLVELRGCVFDVLPDLCRVQQRALEQTRAYVLAAPGMRAGVERAHDCDRYEVRGAH